MSAKFKDSRVIYSTNPDFNDWDEHNEEVETKAPKDQKLYISIDKKQRKGKKVTLVTGYVGSNNDLKELGKVLKTRCGVGGTVKNNEIIIQGDFKDKIKNILESLEYKCKVKG